ncbi:TetR/AcrR family transcriptional regulator [Streptomyces sp. NPDC093675]|uniref:TetR/AcrR family transcriptional regulator n=1 Tax=Streptomyces sp. NPDC093675 TaxID=3366049 RepID=UPI0037F60883
MQADEAAAAAPRLTRKGQATRDRIAAAAAELMFNRGAAGTSIEDVQGAAGVSPSQIYHYFKDKKSLVKAVIAYQAARAASAFGSVEPRYGRLDSMEALRAWRDFAVDLERSLEHAGGCPLGSLGSELAESDPEARREVAAGFALWEKSIVDGLRAMRARGELRSDTDPERLGLALLTALQGGLLLTQVRRDTAALEACLDAVLDRVESALATA